jgi:hypothetical protein
MTGSPQNVVSGPQKKRRAEKSTFPHGAQLPPLSAAFPRRPQELTKRYICPHLIPRRAKSKWKKRNNLDGK